MGTLTGLANVGSAAATSYAMIKMLPMLAAGISSKELKQDIAPLIPEDCLKKVCSLRGVEYKWKHTAEPDAGLIAEELAEVIPEAHAMVQGYNGIKPLTVIGYLVESIKQLNNEITDLREQLGGET